MCNDWRKTLLDYSNGGNDPFYDQNDWEHLYLPTFQTESECIEDPTAIPPNYDLVTHELEAVEKLEFGLKDWEYNEELTQRYINELPPDWSPIDPVKCIWRVYVNIREENLHRDKRLRVYALPDVYPTAAEYILFEEGYLDSEGNMHFYSMQNIIEDIMSKIP
jgi:hypothetical protein